MSAGRERLSSQPRSSPESQSAIKDSQRDSESRHEDHSRKYYAILTEGTCFNRLKVVKQKLTSQKTALLLKVSKDLKDICFSQDYTERTPWLRVSSMDLIDVCAGIHRSAIEGYSPPYSLTLYCNGIRPIFLEAPSAEETHSWVHSFTWLKSFVSRASDPKKDEVRKQREMMAKDPKEYSKKHFRNLLLAGAEFSRYRKRDMDPVRVFLSCDDLLDSVKLSKSKELSQREAKEVATRDIRAIFHHDKSPIFGMAKWVFTIEFNNHKPLHLAAYHESVYQDFVKALRWLIDFQSNVGEPFNVVCRLRLDDKMEYSGEDVLKGFTYIKKLGSGGFCDVYLAHHNTIGNHIAVKVFDTRYSDLAQIERETAFLQETIRHENTVIYMGSVRTASKLYLLMEYCDAGSLFEVLKRAKERMREAYIAYILRCTLLALKYLHRARIIHRDIKSGNILLTRSGKVKLTDFGISYKSGAPAQMSMAGSPLYMPPEVWLRQQADYKADVWSLGIMAWEIANLKPPYAGDVQSIEVLASYIINRDPPRLPTQGVFAFSQVFADFVACCLKKDPKDRASVDALLQHDFLKEEKVVGPDDGSLCYYFVHGTYPRSQSPWLGKRTPSPSSPHRNSSPTAGHGVFGSLVRKLSRALDPEAAERASKLHEEKRLRSVTAPVRPISQLSAQLSVRPSAQSISASISVSPTPSASISVSSLTPSPSVSQISSFQSLSRPSTSTSGLKELPLRLDERRSSLGDPEEEGGILRRPQLSPGPDSLRSPPQPICGSPSKDSKDSKELKDKDRPKSTLKDKLMERLFRVKRKEDVKIIKPLVVDGTKVVPLETVKAAAMYTLQETIKNLQHHWEEIENGAGGKDRGDGPSPHSPGLRHIDDAIPTTSPVPSGELDLASRPGSGDGDSALYLSFQQDGDQGKFHATYQIINGEFRRDDMRIGQKTAVSASPAPETRLGSSPGRSGLRTPGGLRPLGDESEFALSQDDLVELGTIGRGNNGAVLKVLHIPSVSRLALKTLSVYNSETRHQLVHELKAFSELVSPCVVAFIGTFFEPQRGVVALASEFMDCGSLESFVKKYGPIPENPLRYLARQMFEGLAFLHQKRFLHRDIKPDNILLNHEGECKLADFGLVKPLMSTLDQTSSFMGTACYLSPERLNVGQYGFPSDIWSMGITLIYCATGKLPWGTGDYFELREFITAHAPPTLPKDKFSAEFCSFVGECLHHNPAERLTAEQLLRHRWLRQEDDKAVVEWLAALPIDTSHVEVAVAIIIHEHKMTREDFRGQSSVKVEFGPPTLDKPRSSGGGGEKLPLPLPPLEVPATPEPRRKKRPSRPPPKPPSLLVPGSAGSATSSGSVSSRVSSLSLVTSISVDSNIDMIGDVGDRPRGDSGFSIPASKIAFDESPYSPEGKKPQLDIAFGNFLDPGIIQIDDDEESEGIILSGSGPTSVFGEKPRLSDEDKSEEKSSGSGGGFVKPQLSLDDDKVSGSFLEDETPSIIEPLDEIEPQDEDIKVDDPKGDDLKESKRKDVRDALIPPDELLLSDKLRRICETMAPNFGVSLERIVTLFAERLGIVLQPGQALRLITPFTKRALEIPMDPHRGYIAVTSPLPEISIPSSGIIEDASAEASPEGS